MDLTTDFLVAKEQAYWAAAAALAAWLVGALALLVNAVGIYLVWRQLKANREALTSASLSANSAADAAKVARAASRPWVKFEVNRAFLTLNNDNPTEVGCQIDYRIENIGQTPAIRAGVIYRPIPTAPPNSRDIARDFEELLISEPRWPKVLFPGDIVSLGTATNFPLAPISDEFGLSFHIVAAVVYRSEVGGIIHTTPLALQLQILNPPSTDHRIYKGMGHFECLVIDLGEETPNPT